MKCAGESPEYIHLLNLITSAGKDKLLTLIANGFDVPPNRSSFERSDYQLPANVSRVEECDNTSSPETSYSSCPLSVSYHTLVDDLFAATPSPVAPAPAFSVVEEILYTKLIPAICVFGIAGNCLNLLALTSMVLGHRPRMDRMERSATVGLLALAVADLFFCVTVVPLAFANHGEETLFPIFDRFTFGLLYQFTAAYGAISSRSYTAVSSTYLYYFKVCLIYHSAIITLFITLSTWLTVVMAVSRYLAVCHPLQARSIIGMRFAIESIAAAIALSVILNAPRFLYENVACIELTHPVVIGHQDLTGLRVDSVRVHRRQFYFPFDGFLRQKPSLDQAYHASYLIVGIVMPLTLLAYCNFYLIRAIRHSTKLRRQFQRQQHDEQQTSTVAGGGQGQGNGSGGCRIKLTRLQQQKQQVTIIVEDEDGRGGKTGKQSVGAGNGSRRQQRQSSSDSTNVITLTMTIIVIMNVLMVSPAEISNVFTQMILTSIKSSKADSDQTGSELNNSDGGQPPEQTAGQYAFNITIAVANTLQTLNFACNFVLYCVVNVQFRRILRCLVTCKAWWRHPTGNNTTIGSASSYVTYTAGASRTQSPSLRAPLSPSVSERRYSVGNKDKVPVSRRSTADDIGCVLEANSLTVGYRGQLAKVSTSKPGTTKYTFDDSAADVIDLS